MIGPDMRNAIYQLHQAGMSLREISRRLHVSRNAVRRIGQALQTVLDVLRRTRPSPAGIERLDHDLLHWSFLAAFEDQGP